MGSGLGGLLSPSDAFSPPLPLRALSGVRRVASAGPRAHRPCYRRPTLTVGPLTADVEPSGEYRIVAASSKWTLAGKLPGAARRGTSSRETGTDRLGGYRQLGFAWKDAGRDLTGFVRLYERGGLVLFSDTLTQASVAPRRAPFPTSPRSLPGWFHFSYQDKAFSPPQFHLGTTSSPWLFFDAQDHALLISAADHFLVGQPDRQRHRPRRRWFLADARLSAGQLYPANSAGVRRRHQRNPTISGPRPDGPTGQASARQRRRRQPEVFRLLDGQRRGLLLQI